jgi:hypothetical protein
LNSHAVNLFGNSDVLVQGVYSRAKNVLGNDSVVWVNGAWFGRAFNVAGNGNTVTAGPAPLTLAASFFQNNATVTRATGGFNINGIGFPGQGLTGIVQTLGARVTAGSDVATADAGATTTTRAQNLNRVRSTLASPVPAASRFRGLVSASGRQSDGSDGVTASAAGQRTRLGHLFRAAAN